MSGSPLRTRRWLELAVLLALCLPWTAWRAGLESSLWEDEIYSLVLARQPAQRALELSAADAHPPGYYLALGAWLRAGDAIQRPFGGEPGVLWARGLNVVVFAVLLTACWQIGRRLLGAPGGALLTAAVGASAAAAQWAIDLRGYGAALAGSTICLLLAVTDLSAAAVVRRGPGRPTTGRWELAAAYAVAAAAALWCHLLALPLLAVLGSGWIAGRLLTGGRTRWRGALFAAAPQVAGLALFSPWLLRALRQAAAMEAADTSWMTPPTAPALAHVSSWWLPFGRLGDPAEPPTAWLVALGVASFGVPLAAALVAACRLRRRGSTAKPAAGLAILGLGTACLFTLGLWLADRLDLAPVFHGPRYPLLAAGLWAAGLVGAALWALDRRRHAPAPWAAWALLAPWLLAGVVGQVWAGLDERRRGLAAAMPELTATIGGRPLYVYPSELLPLQGRTLAALAPRPIEALPCAASNPAAPAHAAVLDLDPWPGIDRLRDRLVDAALAGRLAESADAVRLSAGRSPYVVHRLDRLDGGRLAALCERGWVPSGRSLPADAVAVALPEDQRRADGWSYLEVGADLSVGRWATRDPTVLRFDRYPPPGDYTLHLRAERVSQPLAEVELGIVLPDGGERRVRVGPGAVHLDLPLRLDRHPARGGEPTVLMHHPVWSPAAALGTSDRRNLTLLLRYAWIGGAG